MTTGPSSPVGGPDHFSHLLATAPHGLFQIVKQERCERKLIDFIEEMWHTVEPARAFLRGWAIEAICLPYSAKVMTEDGEREIGEIVETGWRGRVLSFNHATGETEWKPILAHMKSPERPLVNLKTPLGKSLLASGNHPIFVEGKGYVRADSVGVGDRVIELHVLRGRVSDAVEPQRVLPSEVLSGSPERPRQGGQYASLRALWERVLSVPIADYRRLLQYEVLRTSQETSGEKDLPEVRWGEKFRLNHLSRLLGKVTASWEDVCLYLLRQANVPQPCAVGAGAAFLRGVLRQGMCREVHTRRRQSPLCRRDEREAIPSRVLDNKKGRYSSRSAPLFSLFKQKRSACSSHKSAHNGQRGVEFGDAVCRVPRPATSALERESGEVFGTSECIISKIERDVRLRGALYNIEVADNNNYFADGILTHNCEHLEAVTAGHISRLIINVPPGMLKSLTTCVFWPAWEWGPKRMPSTRYLAAAYASALTERDNIRFRQVITSTLYRKLWGDVFAPSRDQFSVEMIANDKTGWKLATSVGGVGTGQRGDRVILDDPNSVKDVESEAVRTSTNQWFTEVMPTRLNDPKSSAIVIIQQRSHEDDVSGIALDPDRDMGYEYLCIPMEFDSRRKFYTTSIGWTDPRGVYDDGTPLEGGDLEDMDGELCFPERFPRDVVDRDKRTMGPFAVAGQFQQMPEPRGGSIFLDSWWQEYPPEGWPIDIEGRPLKYPGFEFVMASLDTAFGQREEHDFCALTVWGIWRMTGDSRQAPAISIGADEVIRVSVDKRPRIMLIHAWAKRLALHGPPEEKPAGIDDRTWNSKAYREQRSRHWGVVEWVIDSCRFWKVQKLLIEAKASGTDVANELARLYRDEGFAVEMVNPEGDKVARAYSVQHLFSNGQVYGPLARSWCAAVVDQMRLFPRGKHDDLVDSSVHALRWLRDTGLALRIEESEAAARDELLAPATAPALYDT